VILVCKFKHSHNLKGITKFVENSISKTIKTHPFMAPEAVQSSSSKLKTS